MEHLESVEVGTDIAHERIDSYIGDVFDPNLVQDNEDCDFYRILGSSIPGRILRKSRKI